MRCCFSVLCVGLGLALSGCDDCSQSDRGYESAWNGENTPSLFSSKEYREGYDQGMYDSGMYDDGYCDGYNKKKCACPNDLDYMNGYKDGKKRRCLTQL